MICCQFFRFQNFHFDFHEVVVYIFTTGMVFCNYNWFPYIIGNPTDKRVWYFLNHWYQRVGRCVLLNHHEWRECNDRNEWWFSRTHRPTSWLKRFRKNLTSLRWDFLLIQGLKPWIIRFDFSLIQHDFSWFRVISSWFQLIQGDFSWFRMISIWFHV